MDGRSQISLLEWELTDKQGKEAKIIHGNGLMFQIVITHILLNIDMCMSTYVLYIVHIHTHTHLH